MGKKPPALALKERGRIKTSVKPRVPIRQYSILPLFSHTTGCMKKCLYCPYAYQPAKPPTMPPREDWAIYPWKHSIYDYPDYAAKYLIEVVKLNYDIILFATPTKDLWQILRFVDRRTKGAKERIHIFCKINTLDRQISRWIEPDFPLPKLRIHYVEELQRLGWDVYVVSLPNFMTEQEMKLLKKMFRERYIPSERPKTLAPLNRYKRSPLYKPLMKRATDTSALKGLRKKYQIIKSNKMEILESQQFIEEVRGIVERNI